MVSSSPLLHSWGWVKPLERDRHERQHPGHSNRNASTKTTVAFCERARLFPIRTHGHIGKNSSLPLLEMEWYYCQIHHLARRREREWEKWTQKCVEATCVYTHTLAGYFGHVLPSPDANLKDCFTLHVREKNSKSSGRPQIRATSLCPMESSLVLCPLVNSVAFSS